MTTMQDKFTEYNRNNPSIYAVFDKFTREAIRGGHRKLSAWLVMNRVRWETSIATTDAECAFKVSNNYIAHYARLWMDNNPEYVGLFNTKALKV